MGGLRFRYRPGRKPVGFRQQSGSALGFLALGLRVEGYGGTRNLHVPQVSKARGRHDRHTAQHHPQRLVVDFRG